MDEWKASETNNLDQRFSIVFSGLFFLCVSKRKHLMDKTSSKHGIPW